MVRSFECIGILDDSTNNMLNLSDVNTYVDSSEADGLLLFENVQMAIEWLEQQNCANPDDVRPVKVTVTVDDAMLDIFPHEYSSIDECKASGRHLTSTDKDGYCNFCGEQDE